MNHYLEELEKDINTLKTSDLYLSAYLSLSGIKVITVYRFDPQRCNFVFERREDMDKLIETFRLGQARVEPKQYMFKIRELKSMLYINKKYPIKKSF